MMEKQAGGRMAHKRQIVQVIRPSILAALVALALASCGGAVQLERTEGVPRYKALP